MQTNPKRPVVPRETLNIRIHAEVRSLIDRAAAARGTTRTDFILDAARRAAEDTLLDRALFTVSHEAWEEFVARLEAPARPNELLARALRAAPPWHAGG